MAGRLTQQTIEALLVGTPSTRLTQSTVEVLFQSVPPDALLTQQVIEVLYSESTGVEVPESVESTITVDSTAIGRGPAEFEAQSDITVEQTIDYAINRNQIITSAITVAGVIAVDNSVKRLTVESIVAVSQNTTKSVIGTILQTVQSNVAVTQTITRQALGTKLQSVATIVAVTQTIADRSTAVRKTVTSPVTVAQTLDNKRISLSVESGITVTQTIASRNSVVRMDVVTAIDIDSPSEEENNNKREEIITPITVSDEETGVPSPTRDSITETITITSTAAALNPNVRLSRTDAISITQSIVYWTGYLFVADGVSVAQTIGFRLKEPRLTVTSEVGVGHEPEGRPTNNRQEVVSEVAYYDLPGVSIPVNYRIDPNRSEVNSIVRVAHDNGGGPNPRLMSVTQPITVEQDARHNYPEIAVRHDIEINEFTNDGVDFILNPTRLAVETAVLVTETIAARNPVHRLTNHIHVASGIHGQGPIVDGSISNRVRVLTTATVFDVLRPQHVEHEIEVRQAYSIRQINIFITHEIDVVQTYRPLQNRIIVTTPVTATQRILSSQHVRQNVTITQHEQQANVRRFSDKLIFTETINAKRIHSRSITQSLDLIETIVRRATTNRVVTQSLDLTDVDVRRSNLIIPVVSGVLVANTVIMQSGSSSIALPAAEFDDGESNVSSLDLKRSMNGLTYTFIKSTDRRRLRHAYILDHTKALELYNFLSSVHADQIHITNWKGQVWVGKLKQMPIELNFADRRGNNVEKVEIELEFEAVKISG